MAWFRFLFDDTGFISSLQFFSPDTHPWSFSKSKFNLKSDRVNLVAPASPIECPGDTIQTGKVEPAWKFKCTTAAREALVLVFME